MRAWAPPAGHRHLPPAREGASTTPFEGARPAEWGRRGPAMAAEGAPEAMPDLSHLTEDERKIIESVMQRQRIEQEKETELMR